MAVAVRYQDFVDRLGKGDHNLSTGVLKLLLSNTAPNVATHAGKADATEITPGNGYVAGGPTIASLAYAESGGTGSLTGTDVTITASGGSIGPFRYVILYNDTPTTPVADPLIQYWDYGSSITLLDGEAIIVDFGATILTIV